MLTVISPAKKLDMTEHPTLATSQTRFQDDATTLARTAQKLSIAKLRKLMDISEPLARLNADRFKAFAPSSTPDNARPAMFIFAGDTYSGLDATSLDADEIAYAQTHLAILSGLYGLLRPLDAIQPYRLEMGSRLKTKRGKSLYDYWGTTLSEALNEQAEAANTDTLVNCASQEYFTAVKPDALTLRVITPQFLEDKPNGPKIVSFFAKKARGAMARFMVQNRLRDPQDLSNFTTGGYAYQPDLSTPERPVFLRPDTAAKPARAKAAS